MSDTEGPTLVDRLQVVHDLLDDPGQCAYFRRGEAGQDPKGTCSFGCSEEPSCMTDIYPPGWPSQLLREVIADLTTSDAPEPAEVVRDG